MQISFTALLEGQNLNLEIEVKISLLVTFIKRFLHKASCR